MKQRYHIFRRENGIFYSLDTLTKKRANLDTTDPGTAHLPRLASGAFVLFESLRGWCALRACGIRTKL
jgi:hypothetical protein